MPNSKISEEELIEGEFQKLLSEYLSSNHRKRTEIIERAYHFAKEAHQGVLRQSGEPYILHPIAVARIACKEIGLGSTSICAALLHDVVEDTEYTIEDIENLFGKKIAQLVDGLTKIAGGIFGDKASEQAENFRKLLITMSEDIRVILIKMADRLHNMRTLSSLYKSKQHKIAGETLYIYAPLAHRLGLFAIKTELEDLSFKYEQPEIYNEIKQKITASELERETEFKNFSVPIVEKLNELGISYEIKARIKSIYSIWKKMENKHIPFEEVYDLYAARIIFTPKREEDEKRECWEIYSIITDIYRPHPDRIRDWISRPKANGYQALHVTVMGKDGNWVEVQIRSKKMDEIAERGFAAHWKYKTGENTDYNERENELDTWLKTIKEILEHPEPNALDFLDTIKLNLYASEIFVFTPKGDIKTFPKDATALDFAFTLHSDIGYHCIAAKVNHKLVPLSQRLQSGDQVEILTSKSQRPKQEWINFITTAKSKTRLIAALRKDRKNIASKGEVMFKAFIEAQSENIDTEVLIKRLINHFKVNRRDELFFLIGNGDIALDANILKVTEEKSDNIIIRYLKKPFSALTSNKTPDKEKEKEKEEDDNEFIDRTSIFYIRPEEEGKRYTFASCCTPIPGEEVIGYVNDNETVTIHKVDCSVATRLKSSFGERLVAARWIEGVGQKPVAATIEINGIDSVGVLNHITQIISRDMAINIRAITIETKDGLFTGKLSIMVNDAKKITALCSSLKKIAEVKSATRIE